MNKKQLLIIFIILVTIILLIAVVWIIKLKIAHSSFDNYYNFRGCKELINKTSDYANCKLTNGKIIKIVKIDNKWFLENDGPGTGLF